MIDHISIGVRDLAAAGKFYDAVLAPLGMSRLHDLADTLGYGKKYPEFWLNARPNMPLVPADTGGHICLRGADAQAIDAFHAAGLIQGAEDDGPPGFRPQYDLRYYAAFLRDRDGNRIEAVTFADEKT